MARLIFEYDALSTLDTLGASGGIYAMLFHPWDGSALDFGGGTPYMLDDFDGDQSAFSLPLSLQSPRLRHFQEVVSSIDLDLDDNEEGEQYTIEYWGKAAATTPSRTNDKLLKVDKITWHDDVRAISRISIAQEESIAGRVADSFSSYVVMMSISYDTETNRIGCVMWLEKNGELQDDPPPTQATFTLYDSEGTAVATASSSTVGADGQFQLEAFPNPVNMNPDESYFCKCVLVDGAGTTHTTGQGVGLWD